MGMNVGSSGSDEPMMDVNTTPLIDVMLVLLVMFIITIPPMKHATKLDLPQATPPNAPTTPPEVINLVIDFDGKLYWNGEEKTLAQVEDYFKVESAKDPQPELHIRPDKWVKYDAVAKVLAAAQRGRMDKLGVVGMDQFM
ncbi:MAG: ExbD/TolR family protein [Steroidobacteraceae bacterium]